MSRPRHLRIAVPLPHWDLPPPTRLEAVLEAPTVDRLLLPVIDWIRARLADTEPIGLERLCVRLTLVWALWVCLPWDTFGAVAGYQILLSMAPEWAWGAAAGIVALAARSVSLTYPESTQRALELRRNGAAAVGLWNLFMGGCFLLASPQNTGGPVYVAVGFSALGAALWLHVAAKKRAVVPK